jgi:hypothetical protein
MMPCTKHCSLCGKAFKGSFAAVMKKLRSHRKREHPTAHKRSVKKALRTKGKLDPLKKRTKLMSTPKVQRFKDFKAGGLVRVLYREGHTLFPEFALYPKRSNDVMLSLVDAGLKQEARGKWVLRTNKFNIFVYL